MLHVFNLSQKSELTVSSLIQIVNDPLVLPEDINPQLKNLIEGLLCKGMWHSTFLRHNYIDYIPCQFALPFVTHKLHHHPDFISGGPSFYVSQLNCVLQTQN